MHQQRVKPPKLSPLRGIGAVAIIFAAIMLDWFLAQLTGLKLGPAVTAIVFWGVGMVIALFAMRRYVLCYSYIMSPTLLRLSFAYGRYERVMTDIYFNNVLFVGDLERAKRRWPDARVNKACILRNGMDTLAVVCKDGGKPAIYLLQPDEEIRNKLTGLGKKKKGAD